MKTANGGIYVKKQYFIAQNFLYQTVTLLFVPVVVSLEKNRGLAFGVTCIFSEAGRNLQIHV